MKKFKTFEGEEVKMGDTVEATLIKEDLTINVIGTLDESYLKFLLKHHLIKPEEDEVEYNIDYFITRLAERKHWNIDNMHNYLKNVKSISISAFMNIMAKEVALFLNEGYQNHISDSKEIWIISMLNGEVLPIRDKEKIITYKSFAAFRSRKEAYFALNVLSPIIEELFRSEK